jgi:hypothetical protein
MGTMPEQGCGQQHIASQAEPEQDQPEVHAPD